MDNYKVTLISQYANAQPFLNFVDSFNSSVDPGANVDDFYSTVLDIDTAKGFGLDIWGAILGVGRNLLATAAGKYVGFNEGQTSANDYQPFGSGVFYVGQSQGAFTLGDEAYRTLLMAKALSNIIDGSIPAYNRLLTLLFPTKVVYCNVTASKQVQLIFNPGATPFELAIVNNSGALARPVGTQFTT